jgi:hypothetical protein
LRASSQTGRWARAGRGAALSLLLAAQACATQGRDVVTPIEAIQARSEIPESQLLDVSIEFLDPGLPEGEESALEERGIFPDVRRSEARYIPVHLMRTLQSTGNWGAVRVIPPGVGSSDVIVSGQIVKSTGKELEVEIRVVDATGREWLEKTYDQLADASCYQQDKGASREPFQNLYNRIANDILAERGRRDDAAVERVHQVAELRFASSLAPQAFDDYLRVDGKGHRQVLRLPAADDPMLERIARIRQRDDLFIDTLNEHYADFYARMDKPYDDWRGYSYQEEIAADAIKRESTAKTVGGILVGVVGLLLGNSNDRGRQVLSDAAVIGGMALVQSGLQKREEAKIHSAALRELGASLDSEVTPLLVDVEGQTMRLTGSAETQFATWRRMLREIFAAETGAPADPNQASPEDGAVQD